MCVLLNINYLMMTFLGNLPMASPQLMNIHQPSVQSCRIGNLRWICGWTFLLRAASTVPAYSATMCSVWAGNRARAWHPSTNSWIYPRGKWVWFRLWTRFISPRNFWTGSICPSRSLRETRRLMGNTAADPRRTWTHISTPASAAASAAAASSRSAQRWWRHDRLTDATSLSPFSNKNIL